MQGEIDQSCTRDQLELPFKCKFAPFKETLNNHHPTPPKVSYIAGFLYLPMFYKKGREHCDFPQYF
jgi:hypothetical protein